MNQTVTSDRPLGLIERITDASGRNPFLIGLLSLIAACLGFYSLANISLDAVPGSALDGGAGTDTLDSGRGYDYLDGAPATTRYRSTTP